MKKKTIFLILFLAIHNFFFLFSQTENYSITPINIYVGDEVDIRYVISTNPSELSGITSNRIQLEIDKDNIRNLGNQCSIKSMEINIQDDVAILEVKCVPWIVGEIKFPSLDLYKLLPNHQSINEIWNIQLPTITVLSILDKTNTKSLRPVSPPIVIPGTTYIVYGIIILIVIFLVLLCIFFVKLKKVRRSFSDFMRRLFLSKIYKSAKRRIRILTKRMGTISDEVFANELSHIVRDYLENLFDLPFTAATPKEINSLFISAFKGLISDMQQERIHRIYETLVRLDYIRFSATQEELSKKEKEYLLSQVTDLLVFWEMEDD